jgi:hypothetical protein
MLTTRAVPAPFGVWRVVRLGTEGLALADQIDSRGTPRKQPTGFVGCRNIPFVEIGYSTSNSTVSEKSCEQFCSQLFLFIYVREQR